ncbi:MAG: N-acetylmuramic acid 6-phosphate etherase [Treponema sp.]|nr:N-acetylmuramic acid 6-phosphate etherase [Treponema sp.]
MVDLSKLSTEKRNPHTMSLDKMTPLEIATAMNTEDYRIAQAIALVLPQIATAISWGTETLKNNGRIIYIGAGTSGRLGLLDAVECPPTFGVDPDRVIGLIAGGHKAFIKAVEGAEDSTTLAIEDLKAISISKKDLIIGLAASGRTPYVIHGLRFATSFGCKTIAIACTENSLIGLEAQLAIEPLVGPEVLTGSTRLKAGTAQKMILNMISTGSMIGIGKVYQNLMVDLMQTNEKLHSRAENIIIEATNCTSEKAKEVLTAANGSVKLAIVMILLNCNAQEAAIKLDKANGKIRVAIT